MIWHVVDAYIFLAEACDSSAHESRRRLLVPLYRAQSQIHVHYVNGRSKLTWMPRGLVTPSHASVTRRGAGDATVLGSLPISDCGRRHGPRCSKAREDRWSLPMPLTIWYGDNVEDDRNITLSSR